MQMKKHSIDCEWLDVGKFIKDNNIKYAEVISQKGNETKVFSEQYNLRFLCDGLIKYKGEYYAIYHARDYDADTYHRTARICKLTVDKGEIF